MKLHPRFPQDRPLPLHRALPAALALSSTLLLATATAQTADGAAPGTATAQTVDGASKTAPSAQNTASDTQPSPAPNTAPEQPAKPANRLPAAPDTGDAQRQARSCYVPEDLRSEPGKLPGLSAALIRGKGDLLVIMLGSESTSPRSNPDAAPGSNPLKARSGRPHEPEQIPLAARLQARLTLDLAPLPGRSIHVESIGRRNSTAAEQAALISKKVLPRKPALVIWNLGRADARRGMPPASMARALDKGLEQLRRQHIDTIVMDPPYHPQFEAFFRTDDYRQYVRWTMNLHDQPWLHRYDMIDYWASTGRIDLDSPEPDRQEAALTFTETCIAYQLSTLIDRALSRK